MKYFLSIFFSIIVYISNTYSQQSGRVYEFLSLPPTAKVSALGGLAAPSLALDPGMALLYPSLLDSMMHNHVSLNFSDHFSDINYGNVSYFRDYRDIGTFAASINYISYGKIKETDQFGWVIGEFSPLELAFGIAWGKKLSERLRIGSNVKYIYSSFFDYNSSGLATDISLTYKIPENNLVLAALMRNAGRQITYYHEQSEPLPFDILIGVSKKLENAPLRFSIVANNLHRYNLRFQEAEPEFADIDDEVLESTTTIDLISGIADNIMRHITVGAELAPFNSFSFRIGYNYRRRQELGIDDRMSSVGLSWGVGIRISKFEFHYGRSHFHLAGSQNHITVGTNIDELFNRNTQSW